MLSLPPAVTAAAAATQPTRSSTPIPIPSGSTYISAPLKGSLQHTGHGDMKHDRCWGTPEGLDESVKLLTHSFLSHRGRIRRCGD